MSTFDYSEMAAVALELLTEFGGDVTIARNSTVKNPITGINGAGAVGGPYTVKGVVTNYEDKDIDGTKIKAGDRKLIIDSTVEPYSDDTVAIAGETLGSIVSPIKTIKPASTVLCYILQMRK